MTDEHYNNAADAIFVASPTAGEGANCGGSHFVGAHIAVSFVLDAKSCHRPTSGPRSANKLSWPNELATACHSAVGFASGSLCPSAARVGAARARRHLRKPSRQTAAAALLPASCCLEFVELREPSFGERRTHHAAPPLTNSRRPQDQAGWGRGACGRSTWRRRTSNSSSSSSSSSSSALLPQCAGQSRAVLPPVRLTQVRPLFGMTVGLRAHHRQSHALWIRRCRSPFEGRWCGYSSRRRCGLSSPSSPSSTSASKTERGCSPRGARAVVVVGEAAAVTVRTAAPLERTTPGERATGSVCRLAHPSTRTTTQ
jgi:hypothetical protein